MTKQAFAGWLRRYSLVFVAALGGAAGVAYAARHRHPASPTTSISDERPAQRPERDTVTDTVQIAILLDTSSSMDGLINQARGEMWGLVDQMSHMTRLVDGKTRGVKLQLALYEYGNDRIPAKDGYIRQVQPFTGDLDLVSEKLFSLMTDGGEEYVPEVIKTASEQLQWSPDPSTLKFIYVAGNETFVQGPITPKDALAEAVGKDIHVQLILCGEHEDSWQDAAKLAGTDLMTIDQNAVAQDIPAPQDDEILRLNAELNGTYMSYGAAGHAAANRQASVDAMAMKVSKKAALARVQAKAGKMTYHNESWDLVDGVASNDKLLADTPDDQLPEEMRGKSLDEKKAIVEAHAHERADLQAKIAKLETDRTAYLAAARAKSPAAPAPSSLGSEMMKSTKAVATKKGYAF